LAAIRNGATPVAYIVLACVVLFAPARTIHPAETADPKDGVVELKVTTHKDVDRAAVGSSCVWRQTAPIS